MDISGILLRGWKEREEKRTENNTTFFKIHRRRLKNEKICYKKEKYLYKFDEKIE